MASRVPQAVFCLLTALRIHGLTTQEPFEVWIAINNKSRGPQSEWPPLRVVRPDLPAALAEAFTTYLGWLLPWGSRLTVIGTTAADVAEAQRQLARIGVDQLGGGAHGSLDEIAPGGERAQHPVVDFAGNPHLASR